MLNTIAGLLAFWRKVTAHAVAPRRRGLLGHVVHRFNTDPKFQFVFHLVGTGTGAVVLVAMPVVFFLLPGVWAQVSILALVLITIYGNLSTDYCGVSDAEAAGHGAALRGIRASAVHHRVAGTILDRLTTDAHLQYRLHLALTWNWAVQGVAAVAIFVAGRPFWNRYDLLYTLLVNGYTNFGTDFSALPGTVAAEHLSKLRHGASPWEPEPT